MRAAVSRLLRRIMLMKGTGGNRKRTIAEGSTPGVGMQVGERKGKGVNADEDDNEDDMER